MKALTKEYFLCHNQFLPNQQIDEMFLSDVDPTAFNRYNVVFISHRWLQPDNPDPLNEQFNFVKDCVVNGSDPNDLKNYKLFFYDFSCLPQSPRTEAEDLIFKSGLMNLQDMITTSRFFWLPSNDYFDRSWCLFEYIIYSQSSRYISYEFDITLKTLLAIGLGWKLKPSRTKNGCLGELLILPLTIILISFGRIVLPLLSMVLNLFFGWCSPYGRCEFLKMFKFILINWASLVVVPIGMTLSFVWWDANTIATNGSDKRLIFDLLSK